MQKYQEMIALLQDNSSHYKHTYEAMVRESNRRANHWTRYQAIRNEISACIDKLLSLTNHRYRELRELKESKRGKVVLLMGNGPSASMIDWSALESYHEEIDLAVVNFFTTPDRFPFDKVKTVVLSDPITLTDSKRLRPELNEKRSTLINNLKRIHDAHIFTPRFYLKHTEISSILKTFHARVVPFSDYGSKFWGGISPEAPRSFCSMTLLKALSILNHLGYSKMLLIGTDNDYGKNMRIMPDNSVACIDEHAGSATGIVPVNNHSPLSYYKSLVTLEESWGMLSMLPVCNLDPLSFVSTFPKVNQQSPYIKLLKREFQEDIKIIDSALSLLSLRNGQQTHSTRCHI